MYTDNLLKKHTGKRETCLIWLIAAIAYTSLYSVLKDPMLYTVSMIGREHRIFFVFFCFLYGAGMLLNLNYMRRTFNITSKFWIGLSYFFNLSMGFVATTIMPNKALGTGESTFATIVHWIFGFGGIIANATLSLVYTLLANKHLKKKKVDVLIFTGSAVCILDFLVFAALTIITRDPMKAKNGIFEIVPIMVTFAVTFIMNHTDFAAPKEDRDKAEKAVIARDTSKFTATAYGLFATTWILFTTYSFIRSPINFTISMIGVEYFGGFALVCVMLALAIGSNFLLMHKRRNYKNKFVTVLSVISSAAIVPCVFQSTTLEGNIGIIHSLSALIFFFGILASMLFYIIGRCKENKKYRPFAFAFSGIIAALAATMILMFIVFDQKYGRTGLTELIPLEAIFGFFMLENYTSYFDEKTAKDENANDIKNPSLVIS